jgi:hypothetical protein
MKEVKTVTGRAELLEREEQLQSQVRSLQDELSAMGSTLSDLGNLISSRSGALAVGFANTDFGRPINILGQAERTFDFPRLQRECSFEGIRDALADLLKKHAELLDVQRRLGRTNDELELRKLGWL